MVTNLISRIDDRSITIYCEVQLSSLDRKYLAIAELSEFEILDNLPGEYEFDNTKRWFFFNRLKVPKEIYGRGISKIILTELIRILDKHHIYVINTLNPYGNLNLEQLTKLYSRYGFKTIAEEVMVREPQWEKEFIMIIIE